MKILKNILGLILLVVLTLTACKDDDAPQILPPTPQEFDDLREKALEDRIQEFQFNADDGSTVFTTTEGTQITIDGNCLVTPGGGNVSGNITITGLNMYNRGDMLVTNKPTMGSTPDGSKKMLISGGEFLITASKDGNPLESTCAYTLNIPASLTGGVEQGMKPWNGVINPEDDNLTWEEDTTAQVFNEGGMYYAFFNDFGWTNVDKFYDDSRPKTTILAEVPDGYNNTNSAVYLSYDGEGAGLANLDVYDTNSGHFSEHYGQIPIGLQCHAIFVTAEGNQWRYAVKSVTIAANDVIQFELNETQLASEAQLTAAINALP